MHPLDLANVACGRFDGFGKERLNYWDIAAGYCNSKKLVDLLIILIMNPKNNKKNSLIASNSLIHRELHDLISKKY